MRILIAEDDAKLLKSLIHVFETNKFSVDGVSDGEKAYEYASTGEYDGLVLDIMMPGSNGIEVLKKLRADGITTPAMFLTARTEIDQRVEGLDAGADDYLPKPFAVKELIARVRAMIRRKDSFTPDLLRFNETVLNRSTYQITYENNSATLSGRELQITEILMQNPHIIISTEQLITHIWGWDADIDTSVVWVHISNIRKKLDAIHAPVEIRFVRGAGYVMEAKK